MRRLTTIASPILVLVAGCGETSQSRMVAPTATADAQATITNSPPEEQPLVTPIPKDVTYTIIDENILPDAKRSLDIRLNRKVSKEVLTAIAMKLKNADPNRYDRTFIGYYLPDMQINTRYWATTHFNPSLEVRILGLTIEQEQALKQDATDPSREVIGVWLDQSPFGSGRITIFRKDGKLFMENRYKDGSVGTSELVETPSQRGRRFDYNPDRGNGEYYLINSNGDLQEFASDGPFMTARKVK